MSKVPYFLNDLRWGKRLGDVTLKDQLIIACPMTGKPRALQAGEEAVEFNVTREEQDAWALRSHQNYFKAKEAGYFKDELVSIEVPQRRGDPIIVEEDESPRADSSLEKLAKLKTIYGSPTVTPGNAPGLSTGSSAMLLMSAQEAKKRGTKPLASLMAWAMASGHPDKLASIPAEGARLALEKAGMTVDDIDLIEINEAFAAMPLVSTLIMGGRDPEKVEAVRAKTNVNGGAIALGHPTGATGARLIITLVHELGRRRKATGENRPFYGLVTICGGIGEAESVIVKVDP